MKFTILSLFPEMLESYFTSSIMGKAVERGLIEYDLVSIRDFAADRHRTADDAPYGGGYGMVLKPEPLAAALDSVQADAKRVVYASPAGRLFTQRIATELSGEREIVMICGRYEGIDQRVIDMYVHDQLSIGDYVVSSGEIASLVIVDAIYRLVDGVITAGSLEEESHNESLLEYPHYTRPEVFRGRSVPEILRSGHHGQIHEWRRWKQIERTAEARPDLLARAGISEAERRELEKKYGGQDGSDQGY
ncbi:MAG: tRNA (guanosine(37)-N1)-methyltransferase TrmD [Spirochaetota bacterium]